MEWRRAVRNLGTRFLFAATVVLALILGLSIHRFVWDRNRELRHELVAHHFERSSWFAMNAGKYEELDPDLARRFMEAAAWHAKRAREFQRMSDGEVVHQAEQDLEHDKDDGHLMERAAKYGPILRKRSREASEQAEREGAGARTGHAESTPWCD
jgi:hypothetical protein